MPWFKVDDGLAFHPKVMAAGNAAMGLWVRAGAWSAAHTTDGFLTREVVAVLGGKKPHVDALVKAGLWTAEPEGYRFRDWLDYQPSARDVKLGEDAASTRGLFGNHQRWHVNRHVVDPDCQFCTGDDP
jgi:hypothetical protein